MITLSCTFRHILSFFSVIHVSLLQQCGYTSIHISSDDGSHQVLTVKSVDSPTGFDGCPSNIENIRQLHSHSSYIESIDSHVDQGHSTNYVFAEILQECGKIAFVNFIVLRVLFLC